jgi:predicted peroxiredoxin
VGNIFLKEGKSMDGKNYITTVSGGVEISQSQLQTFKERLEEVKQFHNFIKNLLREGEDFGTVEGVSKPFLFKAGAEKITYALGLRIAVSIQDRRETDTELSYTVKCQVIDKNDKVISEGFGIASSNEVKYYLQIQKLINKNIPQSVAVKSLANTLLKMAEKRAIVDAVLHILGLSNIFTQDEDTLDEDTLGTEETVKGTTVVNKQQNNQQQNTNANSLEDIITGVLEQDFVKFISSKSDINEKVRLIHAKLNKLITEASANGDEDRVKMLMSLKRKIQQITKGA